MYTKQIFKKSQEYFRILKLQICYLSPLSIGYRKLGEWINLKHQIMKAKYYSRLYNEKWYVIPYTSGMNRRYIAMSSASESLFRKLKKTKKITFKKISSSFIYETKYK